MNSERYKFGEEGPEPNKPNPEEGGFSEQKEKLTGADAVVGTLMLGLKIKSFFDKKGAEMEKVFDEVKSDLKSQPSSLKDILSNSIASFSSLALEHEREQKEQKLKIKQKFLDSLQKIDAQLGQLDVLTDFEKIQNETIQDTKSTPHKKVDISEEEKRGFRSTMDASAQEKRDKALRDAGAFVGGLLKMFG